ncbi:uncharacterized protein AB675_2646 [Cyphellophora attinorum]|uniref:Uncharacterized protein n=1 Tax=Cyphellophora attinorum TaxID=1664694 RepID=A0A0N1HAT1_9EURO|nr:uncharacterized protein AB675_2646 [Phialophora attinorum]KPI45284.1 hypothetical protein AB675_2646 [Phialophora attinorum]
MSREIPTVSICFRVIESVEIMTGYGFERGWDFQWTKTDKCPVVAKT